MTAAILAGTRILDLGGELSWATGAELAALGAEVIRVEPPGGDPIRRRPPFLEGIEGPNGRHALDRLLDTAAAIVYAGQAAGFDRLGLDAVSTGRPDLVLATLTPFGLSGPRRDWAGGELVAWAMGGAASMVGDPDRPPLVPGGDLGIAFASRLLLTGLLGALRCRRLGRGAPRVEVSLQEALSSLTAESGLPTFVDDLIPRTRMGSRRISGGPFGHFPTADGHVNVIAAQAPHWDALAAWIAEETGNREALDPGLRGNLSDRYHTHDLVDVFTADLTRDRPSQELFLEGQRRGVTVAPVNDLAAVLADPQLEARGFWRLLEVDGRVVRAPARPFPLADMGRPAARPPRAPRLGEHTAEVLRALGLDARG